MLEKNPIVIAVSVIVKYFKASGLNAIFEQTLKSYVSTRWNTVFRMLESVIAYWDKIVYQLQTHKVHQKEINSISLDELKMMRDFLKPFATAILEAEVTKNPTIDIVLPWFAKLETHLKTSRTDSEMISKLKQIGYAYWNKSVQPNITLWHDMAVFLNPLIKGLKTFTETQKNRIYARAAELMDNFMPFINLTAEDSVREVRRETIHVSDAMSNFLDDSDDAHTNCEASELDEYKRKRVSGFETPFQWWQQNKNNFPRYTASQDLFLLFQPVGWAAGTFPPKHAH